MHIYYMIYCNISLSNCSNAMAYFLCKFRVWNQIFQSDIYFQKKDRKLPFPKDKNVKWPVQYVEGLVEIAEKCLHIKSKRPYIDEVKYYKLLYFI